MYRLAKVVKNVTTMYAAMCTFDKAFGAKSQPLAAEKESAAYCRLFPMDSVLHDQSSIVVELEYRLQNLKNTINNRVRATSAPPGPYATRFYTSLDSRRGLQRGKYARFCGATALNTCRTRHLRANVSTTRTHLSLRGWRRLPPLPPTSFAPSC